MHFECFVHNSPRAAEVLGKYRSGIQKDRPWLRAELTLPADPHAGFTADAFDIVAEGDVELGEDGR